MRCKVFPELKMPSQRVMWPVLRPVRVARSSPGKCLLGAKREAMRVPGEMRFEGQGEAREAREWVDMIGARKERGSRMQVKAIEVPS